MEGEPGHGDWSPGGGGDDAGHGGALQARETLTEGAVEKDVAPPRSRGEQRQGNVDDIRSRVQANQAVRHSKSPESEGVSQADVSGLSDVVIRQLRKCQVPYDSARADRLNDVVLSVSAITWSCDRRNRMDRSAQWS